jgi:hypothetical protein
MAFDLLWSAAKDHRLDALLHRKHELKRLLSRLPSSAPISYADQVEGGGVCRSLFRAGKLQGTGVK